MKKAVLFFIVLAVSMMIHAQTQKSWEQLLGELGSLEDVESDDVESSYELMAELAAHPLNINKVTREDLEQLPFLTARQVEDICEYIYKYAPLQSVHELAMVESLDARRRALLACFVTVVPETEEVRIPSFKKLLKYGRHEAVGYMKIPFYDRKGDKSGYLGYKYKHWLRYTFQYGQNVKLGLIGSQDAGEPFFANRNSLGYDYYSFYLQVRNIGHLKALALGRYRLRFGAGLILNSSYSFGKLATLSSLGRNSNQIFGHSSRSEANYLQGAAATVSLVKGLELTGFVSYRNIDATLNKDSNSVATLLKTGYHRTQSEINRKHNTTEFLGGGNLSFKRLPFTVGLTAFYSTFNRLLRPNISQRYRRYYPQGKDFWNMSVDYSYVSSRFTFSGETATGNCKAVATLNTMSYKLTHELTLMALQRFYSYKYYSLHARSFGESSMVNDESGVFVGIDWQPSRKWKIFFYSDYAYFTWPKYQAAASSSAWDNLLQATYSHGNWSFLARYRIKVREKDNEEKTGLMNETTQRGRLSAMYGNDNWSTKAQVDMACNQYERSSFGWMLSEHLSFRHRWLRVFATMGYFHTQDFSSRVYMYEHALLYNYSFPVFYGEGIRYMFDAEARIGKHVDLIAKVGTTDYFDRDHISSGYQQIDGSAMTDLEVQLRFRF
ncbi:DNA-binding protein [Prevotella sp. oral taxon 376]|uniref:helix-hairpin-helix domain-containing protein n=1 Tax=Prevotella sp. oral taxon 376 TaxID=712466 RepID=UPI000D1FC138|nr:helix-hairpin-helix domain-containing protein [Prevotella sp. oral taxon 376]PTL33799.1 DNA-binding protein [Prevotella sp. oral taxon 376]